MRLELLHNWGIILLLGLGAQPVGNGLGIRPSVRISNPVSGGRCYLIRLTRFSGRVTKPTRAHKSSFIRFLLTYSFSNHDNCSLI